MMVGTRAGIVLLLYRISVEFRMEERFLRILLRRVVQILAGVRCRAGSLAEADHRSHRIQMLLSLRNHPEAVHQRRHDVWVMGEIFHVARFMTLAPARAAPDHPNAVAQIAPQT